MPKTEKLGCGERAATVEDFSTVAPTVKDRELKFPSGENSSCWACNALPCDGGLESWSRLPWIVTLRNSAGQRFLIDRRSSDNPDMFGGLLITGDGRVYRQQLTTGETGRRNFHRSYFEEELPA